MTSSPQPSGTTEIQVLGAPVRIWARSSDRHQDLMREFALMQFGHEDGHSVPSRLLALAEELTGEYSALAEANVARRDAALNAGEQQLDLIYEVPVQVRDACQHLLDLLDEADDFCRTDQLLTLVTPPTQVAFRRWYLGQFIAQIDGLAPQPWDGPLVCEDDEPQQWQA